MKKNNFEYKLVIVVREDLKLTPGKISVQVAHASVSCAYIAHNTCPEVFKSWYAEGQRKVVLKVPGLNELLALKDSADRLGIPNMLIKDAGLTEVPPGTITCLGLGPEKDKTLDKVTGSLPLL